MTSLQRILVVDDSLTNISILGELLKSQYQVFIATNAQKGLQYAKEYLPDLILMDVMMPGINGFEACQILKSEQETANIPLIFITSLNNKEDIIRGFEVGGQDYITKPFNRQELFLRVRTHLELIHSRKALQEYTVELEQKNKELKLAMEELDRLTKIDTLTKLYNRRFMLELIRKVEERYQRYGETFSLAIIDIDNFKKINDEYSHECGDFALVHFAQVLKSSMRENDAIARWGGEEFFLLLPKTSPNEACVICEKLKNLIADSPIEYNGQQIFMTATFGVANYQLAGDLHEVVRLADQALYQGKSGSKNCVVMATNEANA